MLIKVGLTAGDLVSHRHKRITLTAVDDLKLEAEGHYLTKLAGGSQVHVTASPVFAVSGDFDCTLKDRGELLFTPLNGGRFDLQVGSGSGPRMPYRGVLRVKRDGDMLRVTLECNLETYVEGVLDSEVPAYFQVEAMKAQAILARTYALRPRLSHAGDGFNVCDSYLHCQAFNGLRKLTGKQSLAIKATAGQILSFEGKPALALFSSCAGGHTESYEFAFSDPKTNAFPSPPISYLTGVSEGRLPDGYPSEAALRKLFKEVHPDTYDAWSTGTFSWQVLFKAQELESHMHHVIDTMRTDSQFAPFIEAPPSGKFGHLQGFAIRRRGVAGTAMVLAITTSTGVWLVSKELAIRSVFANPDAKIKRLRSARIFFNEYFDELGLLSSLTICGFGFGHGVGLQQIGADGMAKRGFTCKQIISHYYRGADITSI